MSLITFIARAIYNPSDEMLYAAKVLTAAVRQRYIDNYSSRWKLPPDPRLFDDLLAILEVEEEYLDR
jgi:hypothetical protein